MIKAMIEHLATTARFGVHRKQRFSEQFHEDIIDLVSMTTTDICNRRSSNPKVRHFLREKNNDFMLVMMVFFVSVN